MKKSLKFIFSFMFAIMLAVAVVACGNTNNNNNNNNNEQEKTIAEKIELTTATLGDVEFTNADTVKLEQKGDVVNVTGTINAMSTSQKTAYGVEDINHVIVVKLGFDKEKTLSSVKLAGNTTKVYATDSSVEGYAGTLSDFLDNEEGKDAYSKLILAGSTEKYTITVKYTDNTESVITLNISATLATAEAQS